MGKEGSASNAREVGGPRRPGPAPAVPPSGEGPAHPPAPSESAPACPGFTPASDHYANQLRETGGAAFLYISMGGTFPQIDAYAFKTYRDRLLADCGNPTDPIEIMMIEQIALAHMNIGRLQFHSATASSIEGARAYGGLAVQLLGEFRRTALALKGYRAGPHAGAVDGAMAAPAAGDDPHRELIKKGVDNKLGSNSGGQAHDDGTIPLPEPAQGRGGAAEPGEVARVHARRA